MIGRDQFISERSARWAELEQLLGRGALHRMPPANISRVAALYRVVCADLMRARSLGVGSDVTLHLDVLASRAHSLLYAPRPYRLRAIWELVQSGFPAAFRRNWRFNLLAAALFYLPFAIGWVGALSSLEFAESVLPRAVLRGLADAYAEGFSSGRQEGADAMMAGYYVHNNVGIAFRCFATGILFGFGSMFFLVYNGLVTGAVLGHVMAEGHGANILTFICGHGPLELNAIVVSGAAGLQMGYALVSTGGRTRLASLGAAAPDLVAQIAGAALMLLGAAAIEGFWSPSSVPAPIKWGFSAVLTVCILAYLLLAGRPRRGAPGERAAEVSRRGGALGSDGAPLSRRAHEPSDGAPLSRRFTDDDVAPASRRPA